MAGFFDYLLGRDEYASDAPLDPTTGLRPADRRQAGINTLANVSQALMQIGAARNPREAAAAWGMFPTAAATGQTYLDALTKERRVLQQEQGLRNLMKDPEQLKSLGLSDQQMALLKVLPPSVGASMIGKAVNDPYAAETARLNFENLQKQSAQPLTKAVGNMLYMFDEDAGKWVLAPGVTAPAAKKPTSVQEYEYYKAQMEAAGKIPLPFNEFINQQKKSGASQTTVTVGGEKRPLTPGQKKRDEEEAKEMAASSDYFINAEKNIKNLNTAINALKKEEDITGWKQGVAKGISDQSLAYFYPRAQATYDRARSVIQQSLKQILGAQFAQREAEQLIASSYNIALPQEENIERLEILRDAILDAAKLKEKKFKYWRENDGTLAGFNDMEATIKEDLDKNLSRAEEMRVGKREDQRRKKENMTRQQQIDAGLPTLYEDDKYSEERYNAMPSGTFFYDGKGVIKQKP